MSDRLEELVKRLPRRIEPERDLWSGIEARLRPRRPAAGRTLYRFAAAAAVAAIAVGLYFGLRPPPAAPGIAGRPVAVRAARPNPETVVARNLHAVDRMIARIRTALARDPGNPALYDFLYEAYRQKGRLIAERVRLSTTRSYPS